MKIITATNEDKDKCQCLILKDGILLQNDTIINKTTSKKR
jgi:hypothetical protein